MNKIVKIVNSVSRVASVISIVTLMVMTTLLVSNIVGRYFFGRAIVGIVELTDVMMLVIVFMALSWCAVERAHIKVDVVVSRFSARVRAIIDSILYLVGLGICITTAWQIMVAAREAQAAGLVTMFLRIPHFPFYWVIAVGYVMLCLVMVTQLIQYLGKAVKG